MFLLQLIWRSENQIDQITRSYLTKIFNSFIDLFETAISFNYFDVCIELYNKILKHTEHFYMSEKDLFDSNAMISATSIQSTIKSPTSISNLKSTESLNHLEMQMHQSSNKVLSSEIRREIFDFLLRLRTNENGYLCVISRNDRKKLKASKFLKLKLQYYFKSFKKWIKFFLMCCLG